MSTNPGLHIEEHGEYDTESDYFMFFDPSEMEESNILCPDCRTRKLKIYHEGVSPDDYISHLLCPDKDCGYTEQE